MVFSPIMYFWQAIFFTSSRVFSSFLFLVSALWSKNRVNFHTRTFDFPLPNWLFITYLKLIYSRTGYKLIPCRSQEKVIFLMVSAVCQFFLASLKGQVWFDDPVARRLWWLGLNISLCRLANLNTWSPSEGGIWGRLWNLSAMQACHWREALRVCDLTICFLCVEERNKQLAWEPDAVPSSPW